MAFVGKQNSSKRFPTPIVGICGVYFVQKSGQTLSRLGVVFSMNVNQTIGDRVHNDESSLSIHKASIQLGLDSFYVYSLIQRELLRSKRASWGEFLIASAEIVMVLRQRDQKGGMNVC
jgi:hypothetical protein